MGQRLLLGIAVLAAGWSAASAQDTAFAGPQEAAYGPSHSFAAFREGQRIGTHSVSFQREGSRLVVSTSVDLSVKFMGFTAFRYTHRGREVWNGNELVALETTTNDDGKHYVVRAARQGERLVVDSHTPDSDGYRRNLTALVLPTTHWNVRQAAQSQLLNSQKGTVDPVRVTSRGVESVKTASGSIEATRYHYEGKDGLSMDQWFDARGRWVKTTFTAHDGSLIEYVLQ
jgi:hypothetical protein